MSENNTTFRRFTHQPLTVEHYGTNISIRENGTVLLSKPGMEHGEVIIDEIEVPASLIIRVARLLKDTRKVEVINEVK